MQVIGPSSPVKGWRSDVDKSLLGLGWFSFIKNQRCDGGLPVARNTELSILTKPSWATAGPPLGCKSVSINGEQWEIAVWPDGAETRIAVANSSLGRWVEVTGTNQWTGPSGNNRLTSLTAHCQITVIRTPRRALAETSTTIASRDVVLIQNGEDYPRIWDPGSTSYTSYTVTGAVTSGVLIKLTVVGHPFNTGDHLYISNVGGVPNATGLWQITKVNANTFTLDGSVFAGTFTSGGTVLDRADLLVHKPVTDISPSATAFAAPDYFTTILGGETYQTPTATVNDADNRFLHSGVGSAAPYTSAANIVVKWEALTTVDVNDTAIFTLDTGIPLENQVIMLVEGAGAIQGLSQCLIEACTNTSAYASLSASEKLAIHDPAQRRTFQTITENSTANRYWVIFDVSMFSGSTMLQFAVTWKGAPPAANIAAYILAMGGTASNIPSSTVWGFHYEDELNFVEQRFHVMQAKGDSIKDWGGAISASDGSGGLAIPPTFPLVDTVYSHFRHRVSTDGVTSASINGGLNGVPQRTAIYAKLPGADTYYWLTSYDFYTRAYAGSTRKWDLSGSITTSATTFGTAFVLDQQWFNYNREAPSAFQQCVPISSVCEYVNQRLFVGSIKDASGEYAYSDYYFSWDRNPFRFQQVQEDEFRGGYGQLAGERTMAFRFAASGALGAGRVFMFSDQWVYSMGESGPFASAGLAASEIGRPVRIGPHGTLSPRSPAVGYGAMAWVDQDAQVMRLSSGGLQNISTNQIGDRLRTSVATRKINLSGAFWKDRFYFAYTPSGDSLNERVLVWNEQMQAWESEDYETTSINFELLHVWPATPGVIYATRLLCYDSAGTLYGYEEKTDSTVAIGWDSGAFNFDKWTSWYIVKAIMSATSQSATGTLSRVSSKWGEAEPWSTTISYNETGAIIATFLDSVAHTKTGTEKQELDWEWYLSYRATVAPGTKTRRLEFEAQESNVTAGLGT